MDLFQLLKKSAWEEFPVLYDITTWLDGETISVVAYSAVRIDTGADATADVLDAAKHTHTPTAVRPWIKAGTAGITYEVRLKITSSSGAKKEARVQFAVGA